MTPDTMAIAEPLGVIVRGHIVVGPERRRLAEATAADLDSAQVP
jgi:hypothetical protein